MICHSKYVTNCHLKNAVVADFTSSLFKLRHENKRLVEKTRMKKVSFQDLSKPRPEEKWSHGGTSKACPEEK